MILSAKGINKSYEGRKVLDNVDIDIKSGALVSIMGASGAGKSTLLHILGTLDLPDSGNIAINDISLKNLTNNALAQFRNKHIGFIFQFHHLLPEFTVLENVCMPGWIAKTNGSKIENRAKELLERLGLIHLLNQKPGQMSGGEQQRAAVARALINQPDIVFADEPTGNLDSHNAQQLHHLFRDLRTEFGQTFLIVTHNEELAGLCDYTLMMKDGKMLTA